MFGRRLKILQMRIAELEQTLASADETIAALLNKPHLHNVTREGRALKMTFIRGRNGDKFEFETYSTMSSDIKGLLQWANLT